MQTAPTHERSPNAFVVKTAEGSLVSDALGLAPKLVEPDLVKRFRNNLRAARRGVIGHPGAKAFFDGTNEDEPALTAAIEWLQLAAINVETAGARTPTSLLEQQIVALSKEKRLDLLASVIENMGEVEWWHLAERLDLDP